MYIVLPSIYHEQFKFLQGPESIHDPASPQIRDSVTELILESTHYQI